MPNGEISDVSSDAEGGQGEEQLKMSDGDEKEGDSCESEDTIQRAVIEDIRFVTFIYNCSVRLSVMIWLWLLCHSFLVSSFSLTGKVSLASG